MMSRSPDIIFMAEYIKNVLYFAVVRTGKILKSTNEIHYFTIDNELLYENYYSDFGPLNLGCVFKYCKLLNDKLKVYLNKQKIVHYTLIDQKKKTNSAFLLGCFGVLYLNLTPKDALKPLLAPNQNYRPFQDATQGDSTYTITILDCLQAVKKARELGLFDFQDFNYEEYNRLDKIQGGDLNWILPGKFLAFIGPVDYSVSLYHPPEMYIDYFIENNVKIVIRLNKRLYNGNVFNEAGIVHYDLFFPDGSCPPRHILQKFLQISEESEGAIAVHCKAGLGRTGSLIGCYLIKHYRMSAHEAIGWMRICRPGSVIGHQQGWLEQLESWLLKQGNIYRKRVFNDTEKVPVHEFGVYSIAEKTIKQHPVVFHKSPSPPPPAQARPNMPGLVRPPASKVREDKLEIEDEEIFLTSCDLTVKPSASMTRLKGCIIKSNTISEEFDGLPVQEHARCSLWKKILCCKQCIETLKDAIWTLSVRCARVSPRICHSGTICIFIDTVAVNKSEKEQSDRRVKSSKLSSQKIPLKGEHNDDHTTASRRGSGAGDPRPPRSLSRSSTVPVSPHRNSAKSNESYTKTVSSFHPTMTTFRPSNGPLIKNVNDARKFLIKSSIYNEERVKQLNSSLTVTPHFSSRVPNYFQNTTPGNMAHITPSAFSSVSRTTQPQQRRRLGRSPSPPQARISNEHTRATNTPASPMTHKFLIKDTSKSALSDALSGLKLTSPRDGSIGGASLGAASLGARRDAPTPKQAPSVRSDERSLATQGDMLNSIKFQRSLRHSMLSDNVTSVFNTNKSSVSSKENANIKLVSSRTITGNNKNINQEFTLPRQLPSVASRKFCTRPSSPKGRRSSHSPGYC